MKCEQCTFLPGQVEDSSPTSSLDIPQWLQSSGSHTPAKSLENEQPRDGFPDWLCGKEMSETSTHPNTPESWTAFMRASLAKILVSLENKQVLGKIPDLVFTEKSCVLLGQLDPDAYSWKMSPLLKATALNKLSKTWPSWGMTVNGSAYEHPMSERRITETGGSYLPTPVATLGTNGGPNQRDSSGRPGLQMAATYWPTPTTQDSNKATKRWRENYQNNLTAAVFNPEKIGKESSSLMTAMTASVQSAEVITPTVIVQDQQWMMSMTTNGMTQESCGPKQRMFPTPTTRDYKGGYKTESLTRKDGKSRHLDALPNAVLDGAGVETVTGQLNPDWVEWLMGWPIGYSALKQSVTVKSRSKSQSRLPSWLRGK